MKKAIWGIDLVLSTVCITVGVIAGNGLIVLGGIAMLVIGLIITQEA